MKKPRLSTKTPDDPNTNSLIDAAPDLYNNPTERRFIIAEIGVTDVGANVQTGDRKVIYGLRIIEHASPDDRDEVLKLLTKLHAKRTGEKSIPAPEQPADPDTPLPGMEDDTLGADDSV